MFTPESLSNFNVLNNRRGRFILETWTAPPFYSCIEFEATCIALKAAKIVFGKNQAVEYFHETPKILKLQPSYSCIKFGNLMHNSEGKLELRVPITRDGHFTSSVYVIDADVALYIVLRDLKREQLSVSYLSDKFEDEERDYAVPITYKNIQTFITWNAHEIFSIWQELRRLKLYFLYPTTNKLLDLLQRADPEASTKSVCKILRKIAISCEQCPNHSSVSLRSRAVTPSEKLLFNHEPVMFIIWSAVVSIIHAVDTHTVFQNATILRGKTLWTYLHHSLNAGCQFMLNILPSWNTIMNQALHLKYFVIWLPCTAWNYTFLQPITQFHRNQWSLSRTIEKIAPYPTRTIHKHLGWGDTSLHCKGSQQVYRTKNHGTIAANSWFDRHFQWLLQKYSNKRIQWSLRDLGAKK